jgi:hypothetical protein
MAFDGPGRRGGESYMWRLVGIGNAQVQTRTHTHIDRPEPYGRRYLASSLSPSLSHPGSRRASDASSSASTYVRRRLYPGIEGSMQAPTPWGRRLIYDELLQSTRVERGERQAERGLGRDLVLILDCRGRCQLGLQRQQQHLTMIIVVDAWTEVLAMCAVHNLCINHPWLDLTLDNVSWLRSALGHRGTNGATAAERPPRLTAARRRPGSFSPMVKRCMQLQYYGTAREFYRVTPA